MKKILFVNSTLSAGGSEKVMTILANEFSNLGYDVTMIILRNSKTETYNVNSNIKLIRLNYKNKNNVLKCFERIRKIRKIIRENKYDSIISFMHEINTQVLLANIGLKRNVIVSERCDPASRKISKFLKHFEDISYRLAKYIVLQTEQVKSQYPKSLQKKFIVIPNPISENIPKPYIGERKNKIVSAGRFVNQKNFELLLEAFKRVSEKYNYQLFIYGEGRLRPQLEEKINNLNIKDRVFLPGYVQNVDELMNDAKMYVCSSDFEGISNSMLEAMAMGVPTISTDCPVGGAAMTIKDHENGILVPIKNCDKLIEAMLEIIENKDLEQTLSNNGRNIIEELNSKKIVKRWEKLI